MLEEGAQIVADAEAGHAARADDRARDVELSQPERSAARSPWRCSGAATGGTAQTVHIPMPGRVIAAKVTKPVFFDPEGARLNG